MSRELVVLPQAAHDANEAYIWYELRDPGVGEEFLGQLELCQQTIAVDPDRARRIRGNVRKVKMKRFPYFIYYHTSPDAVTVLAVLHGARHSRQWLQQMKDKPTQ
jgi:plasmid stabilization system protein ParE